MASFPMTLNGPYNPLPRFKRHGTL